MAKINVVREVVHILKRELTAREIADVKKANKRGLMNPYDIISHLELA